MNPFPRSFLFVPADRPKLVESAFRSAADALVFDLEDAIAPNRKATAREAAADVLDDPRAAARPVFVRVNGPATGDGDADLRALAGRRCAGYVIPKTEAVEQVRHVARLAAGARLVLVIETPRGVLRSLDVAEAADAERAWAERVTSAYEEAAARGHGSVRVDDHVVDAVTIERARQVLDGRR